MEEGQIRRKHVRAKGDLRETYLQVVQGTRRQRTSLPGKGILRGEKCKNASSDDNRITEKSVKILSVRLESS